MRREKCSICDGKGYIVISDKAADYKAIGLRIRTLRKKAGMTQEYLAGKSGVLRTSINNIEAARQHTPLDVLYRIADVLGVTIVELLHK